MLGINEAASDLLVPAPTQVAESLWDDRDLLAEHGWVTLKELLAGVALAVALGAAFAVAMHLSDTLRRAFYPLLVASQTIPIVAIAPVLVIWLGFGIGPTLAVIVLICFFPVTVNTLDGLRSVDPDAIRMMRTLDAGRGGDPAAARATGGAAPVLQRRQDRRGGGRDRRRLRRVRLGRRGARLPDQAGAGAAADRARVRRRRRTLRVRDRPLRVAVGCSSAATRGGAPRGLHVARPIEEDDRERPRRTIDQDGDRAGACARLPHRARGRLRREGGAEGRRRPRAVRAGPRLLRQPRPRRHLRRRSRTGASRRPGST